MGLYLILVWRDSCLPSRCSPVRDERRCPFAGGRRAGAERPRKSPGSRYNQEECFRSSTLH